MVGLKSIHDSKRGHGDVAGDNPTHYDDVTMGTIASQITSLASVYSIVYSSADQRKHQSSVSLAFVWGIHRGPVNSPHKWPVTRKMFPFDDVIMVHHIFLCIEDAAFFILDSPLMYCEIYWYCYCYSDNCPKLWFGISRSMFTVINTNVMPVSCRLFRALCRPRRSNCKFSVILKISIPITFSTISSYPWNFASITSKSNWKVKHIGENCIINSNIQPIRDVM